MLVRKAQVNHNSYVDREFFCKSYKPGSKLQSKPAIRPGMLKDFPYSKVIKSVFEPSDQFVQPPAALKENVV